MIVASFCIQKDIAPGVKEYPFLLQTDCIVLLLFFSWLRAGRKQIFLYDLRATGNPIGDLADRLLIDLATGNPIE